MGARCISKEQLETTGFSYTLSLINGKYKMTILYTLMEYLRWKNLGHVLAGGNMMPGDVDGKKEVEQAYELGKSI